MSYPHDYENTPRIFSLTHLVSSGGTRPEREGESGRERERGKTFASNCPPGAVNFAVNMKAARCQKLFAMFTRSLLSYVVVFVLVVRSFYYCCLFAWLPYVICIRLRSCLG